MKKWLKYESNEYESRLDPSLLACLGAVRRLEEHTQQRKHTFIPNPPTPTYTTYCRIFLVFLYKYLLFWDQKSFFTFFPGHDVSNSSNNYFAKEKNTLLGIKELGISRYHSLCPLHHK